ncbi:ROK family protein [Roseiconus lacunae]|uniref:ROK family protein n=1 Tax=Roseiconus lacunae TaxID=2605694 RepID=UPI001E421CB9|nr:ROK family protein [Roseiconus lacunae]MCD0463421.1 ROK family protein [Roseiconus lacunae]
MAESSSQPRFVGIDLGGTSAKIAIADRAGHVMQQATVSTQADGRPTPVIESIRNQIRQLCDQAGHPVEQLKGIGMGVPGLVDIVTGTTKFLPNLPTQWRDIEVAEQLADTFRCPVKLLNDVRTATLGELRFGYGRSTPEATFAFFSIGTGIGGGLVIDGKVHLGRLGAAGELGHQTIVPDGLRCGCGNRGCLETLASGPAITAEGIRLMLSGLAPKLRELTDGHCDRVNPETMAEAADDDTLVDEAIRRAAAFLGIGAANVVSMVHPDAIVLGGGVSLLGDRLINEVRNQIQTRVRMFPTDQIEVICSTLSADAGLRGAIALAIDSASDNALSFWP